MDSAGILSLMTVAHGARSVKGVRRRHPPAAMRAEVIRVACDLLRTEGPHAITLKAVALRAGVTHGNVTYHFGTVAALHAALIATIIEDLTAATAAAVFRLRAGDMSPRGVVDVVFDALVAGGAGRLIAWLAATGGSHRLTPFYAMIADLVGGLSEGDAGERAGGLNAVGLMVAAVVVPALGGSLIGADIETALGLREGSVKQVVADGMAGLREAGQR
jgi:AcrR family transcriptional regulator